MKLFIIKLKLCCMLWYGMVWYGMVCFEELEYNYIEWDFNVMIRDCYVMIWCMLEMIYFNWL